MIDTIRKALELHLTAFPGAPLPTIWQNRNPPASYKPDAAHQKAFLMPANNRSFGLRERTTLHSGIFQVNLCYPTGIGAYEPESRAVAIAEHFKGQILEADGVKVQIRGTPDVAAPVSVSPYVVPVTIRYQTII